MSNIGYARVSTIDQTLDIQIEQLSIYGCNKIFSDTASGCNTKRKGFLDMLEYLREGDSLVITRIDRIARSVLDLQQLVTTLKDRGIKLVAIEQPISTDSAAGKAFLDMLSVFAEFELNIRKERQAEGIAAAKKAGKYKGRKPVSDEIKLIAQDMYEKRHSITSIAKELKLSRNTVYKLLKCTA